MHACVDADKADELLLIFTHIDPSSHPREFLIGLHAEEDNTYHGAFSACIVLHVCGTMSHLFSGLLILSGSCAVTRCQPALEGLDAMLANLNRTNGFKTFIRDVRKKFRKLVD